MLPAVQLALSSFSESLAHQNVTLGRTVVLNVVTRNVTSLCPSPLFPGAILASFSPSPFSFLCLCLLWYPALFKCGSLEGRPHAEKCHQIYICFLFSSLGARNHTSPPSRRGAGTPLCTARLQGPSLGSTCLQQCRPIFASPPLQVREPGDQEQAGFAPLELTQSRFLSPALDSLAPCWGNCRSLICESSAKAVT